MAARIASSSLRASIRARTAVALPQALSVRLLSTKTPPPPEERAAEIVNKLPSSPGLITKTGTVLLGTGAIATAISQELYVVNEETIVLVGSIILFTYLGKILREPYIQWAEGNIQRIKGVLNASRAEHTEAVKDRIAGVAQMKDVVDITKALFAVAKETAHLESRTFVQQQKVAVASELKLVLDSWVRYEQQQKEKEQSALANSVIARVQAALKEEKTQVDVLASAVAEVERMVKNRAI